MADHHAHSDAPDAESHVSGEIHHHPGWSTYWKVALILTIITVWEVWAYYIPSLVASRIFVPMLLILSALKFAIVTDPALIPDKTKKELAPIIGKYIQ